jgi:colanic acid biosynthesis glycosyl transferase WcaI
MKILILNQAFYPDVVSTAQHAADLAVKLVEEGHEVTVIAGRRGYDDPGRQFPAYEEWKGVRIHRFRSLTLGKQSKWRRALNFGTFLIGCAARLMMIPRHDVVIALTSPPLISYLATLFVQLKGGRLLFWIMDLNPDEAIAAGWLSRDSFIARALSAMLGYSLRKSAKVVVLDRFMKQRILEKGVPEDKVAIIPPWSHDGTVRYDERGRDAFRERHRLSKKWVVMYSGNHSPCHPMDTVLSAALELSSDSQIVFCFVGGGSEFKKVRTFAETHQLKNTLCLPYQPLSELAGSLSAADMHLVVMGDAFKGLVHPCKVYNILTVGKPILYIGPAESHVADIATDIQSPRYIRTVRHGDIDAVVAHIRERAVAGDAETGEWARTIASSFSIETILPKMVKLVASLDETMALCDSEASQMSRRFTE